VVAIAAAAQTGPAWSTAEALAAVAALEYGGSGGPTPLDALDAFVDGGVSAGQAAKLIVLVVEPLGLDPTDFDPAGDSAAAVDLVTILDPDGCAGDPADYGFFNATLFGALAKALVCGAPNPAVMATIRAGQRADGGWNYLGDADDDPFAADSDVDTTALAVQALVAGGAAWNDAAITAALRYLAGLQAANGAFPGFAGDDPNSTAVAMLAVAAAGFDPSASCWRDTVDPAATGTAYGDPATWLRSQQQVDGRVASPFDGPTPNTFPTSQAVQGWLRAWLPIARAAGAPDCAPPAPLPSDPSPEPPVVVPGFTG
jgi:hypothetical protein